MLAGTYLEQLQQDLEAQGLGRTTWADNPGRPYWLMLKDVLALTRFAGHEKHREAASSNPSTLTEIGKLALDYGQNEQSVPFFGFNGYQCCHGAERRLVQAIGCTSVANKNHVSPVVVVKMGKPLAIIKGYEERTSYGLVTDLATGILAGAFSQPPDSTLERMRQSDRPFYLDLDTSEHRPARLLRLGAFLVPTSIRSQLVNESHGSNSAVRTETHEQLIARAEELLADAIPLPPADEASRQTWNQGEMERYMQFS